MKSSQKIFWFQCHLGTTELHFEAGTNEFLMGIILEKEANCEFDCMQFCNNQKLPLNTVRIIQIAQFFFIFLLVMNHIFCEF